MGARAAVLGATLVLIVGLVLAGIGLTRGYRETIARRAHPSKAPVASKASEAIAGRDSPDAIVVGSGIAGLSAAYELANGGARVLVIDMASVFGGHAVMATGDLCLVDTPFQRARGIQDSADLAYQDFMRWGEAPNSQWVRYYVEHSRDQVYDWLTSLGIVFEKLILPAGNSVERTHRTLGRGIGLVSPIFVEVARMPNVSFQWNTQVERLSVEAGRVVGVATKQVRSGMREERRAAVVVLATGGFQSNLDRVRAAWSPDLPFPKRLLIGSGIHSMGTGLDLASGAGAALVHLDWQWNYITGLPDPRYPAAERGVHAVNPDSVWVDATGRRFIAERSSTKLGLPVLVRLPGSTYWSVFDQTTKHSFWMAGSDWASFDTIERLVFANSDLVKTADSLPELARSSGLPAEQLQRTIAHWNEMVDRGNDEDFGRFGPDKAFKPKRIETPPYYAAQFFPLTRKSMGGVAIDAAAHVVDGQQRVIPGLYAAGELTGVGGINGKAALEGTFLAPSIVTGRVAGRTALAEIGARQPPLARPLPAPVTSAVEGTAPTCMNCHDLPTQIHAARPGYWHFEKVHGVVLERQYDCMKCHAELGPSHVPETHHIDRISLVHACTTCHSGEDR
jgi:flavocytochrome c